MNRGLCVLLVTCAGIVGLASPEPAARGLAQAPAQPPTSSPPVSARGTAHRGVLDRYCVTCHNERLISYLETQLDRAAEAGPVPGRTEAFHRLNRAEYQNAVRDLLAVDIDVSGLLPADDADAHGFDNMADVLTVSPALLDRYLSAARKISRLAVGIAPTASTIETYRIPLLLYQDDRLSEDLPFGSRGGIAVRHRFPVDGDYSIRLRLQRTYTDYIRGLGTPQHLDVRVDGRLVRRFTVGGGAPTDAKAVPASFAGNTPLFGDPEWEVYVLEADNDLEVTFPARAGHRVVGVSFERKLWQPEGVLQPRQTGFPLAINERWDGNAAVSSVEIGGPHTVDGPGDTASRRTIFACHPSRGADEARCARDTLARLARRAYRRPVTDHDVDVLLQFYEERRRTEGFEAGIARSRGPRRARRCRRAGAASAPDVG